MALHDHCSYCGTVYVQGAPWPRICAACGETTWRNPLPVAVALLPVDTDQATEESLGFEVSVGPRPLCFPTHTAAMASYFASE